jgi:hypothetical protein
LASSCNQEVENENYKESVEEVNVDSLTSIPDFEGFAQFILNEQLREHNFKDIIENCRYQKAFPIDGLEKIVAYSDKSYPEKIAPSEYEHFVLFCFEYSSVNQAKLNFDSLCYLTQLDTSKCDAVEQSLIDKSETLNRVSKSGGLILQKDAWIFSLVETCRNTPIVGNWIDYENLFVSYLGNNLEDSLMVLNADCGQMKYMVEKRPKLTL